MTPLVLPFPPSANSIWRSVGGRNIMSERYRNWRTEALVEIMLQKPERVLVPYRLTIIATRPDKRPRDIDNLAKPLCDALKLGGVIRDDSDAVSILLAWSTSKPDKTAGVSITLEAA